MLQARRNLNSVERGVRLRDIQESISNQTTQRGPKEKPEDEIWSVREAISQQSLSVVPPGLEQRLLSGVLRTSDRKSTV